MKITYTNNKKINEMIDDQKRLIKHAISFAGLAIISEIGATICTPDPILATCAILNTIGVGICATAVNNLDREIEEYEKTYKK